MGDHRRLYAETAIRSPNGPKGPPRPLRAKSAARRAQATRWIYLQMKCTGGAALTARSKGGDYGHSSAAAAAADTRPNAARALCSVGRHGQQRAGGRAGWRVRGCVYAGGGRGW